MRKFINIIKESQAEDLEKIAAMSDDMQEETPQEGTDANVEEAPVEQVERPVRGRRIRPIK